MGCFRCLYWSVSSPDIRCGSRSFKSLYISLIYIDTNYLFYALTSIDMDVG